MTNLGETISLEADLLSKLKPLPETEIFEFMKNLRGGTYFNMGMYSFIPVSRAYKKTKRIYKVLNQTAIVSGVSYENIGTTKDFRDQTGKGPGGAWYDHMPGYENKVGTKKSDPNCKYVLWNVKAGSSSWVRYYLVDIESGSVMPISEKEVMDSEFLTPSEKAKMEAKPSTGFNLTTGEIVENNTKWRTAAFEHIFWLSQSGANTKEYGVKFMESKKLSKRAKMSEAFGDSVFRDAHADITTNLDAILAGDMDESIDKSLAENVDENTSSYNIGVDGSDKMARGRAKKDEEALSEIIDFINTLTQDEKDNMWLAWMEDDEHGEFGGDVLVSVYSPEEGEEAYAERTISNWPEAESKIRQALGVRRQNRINESYRRIISRGKALNDNELFVDFD